MCPVIYGPVQRFNFSPYCSFVPVSLEAPFPPYPC